MIAARLFLARIRGPVRCEACGRRMDGSGCTLPGCYLWGDEPGHTEPVDWSCHDCGVRPGGRHHAGCVLATCRTCGDQAAYCGHC
jgi:hypothetical protein